MNQQNTLNQEQLLDIATTNTSNVFEAVSKGIESVIEKYGISAVESVLWVIRVDNAEKLFFGIIMLVGMFLFWHFFFKKVNNEKTGTIYMEPEERIAVIISFGICTFIVTILILVNVVFNIWVWVGIFNPELWIVKQIVFKLQGI